MLKLLEVNPQNKNHISILFNLLKERKYSISHENNITLEDHTHFVKNNPYRKWYIVFHLNKEIGSCYCTYQNYIGINLITEEIELYKDTIIELISTISPLPPKASIRNKDFCFNVPTYNKKLKEALLVLSAVPIQTSFLLPQNNS